MLARHVTPRRAAAVTVLATAALWWGWAGVAWAAIPAVAVLRLGRRQPRHRRSRPNLRAIAGSPRLYRCTYCHTERASTWDHVVPRSLGGPDTRGNLVPACRSCNSSKGARPLGEWLADRRQ